MWLPPEIQSPFLTSRIADGGRQPGQPSWGPHLNTDQAKELERHLLATDPDGVIEWDARADQRRAAWLASPFAERLERIVR